MCVLLRDLNRIGWAAGAGAGLGVPDSWSYLARSTPAAVTRPSSLA